MSLSIETLDLIAYEVAKVRNLMAALEIATDCMFVPDDEFARKQRDATVGLVNAMGKQLAELDRIVEDFSQQAVDSKKAA